MANAEPSSDGSGAESAEGGTSVAPAVTAHEAGLAMRVFGDRYPLAERFVGLLADTGISHGLIGPREGPRLWERHVLNCAVVHEAIPRSQGEGSRVIDIGSGAGLPGLALAIARPELEVHLVEPLARRTQWLASAVEGLGLDNVVVHTARAEDLWGRLAAPTVTARAVGSIVALAKWGLPLLTRRGSLLALKGATAEQELDRYRGALRRLGVVRAVVERFGPELEQPTRVIVLEIDEMITPRRAAHRATSSSGSARRRSDRRKRDGSAECATGQ